MQAGGFVGASEAVAKVAGGIGWIGWVIDSQDAMKRCKS
jgi:hypothetical protein